jgi:diguanylate cyclase (GGDEF)-like protein
MTDTQSEKVRRVRTAWRERMKTRMTLVMCWRSSLTPRDYKNVISACVLSPSGVILSGIFLSLCMCGFGSWSLYESREDAHVRAVQNAKNLLLVVERDISRNLEIYDLSLQAVVDGVANPEVMALPQALRDQLLFDRAASARHLEGIVALDEHGNVIAHSQRGCTLPVNLSDREYFAVQRDHPDAGLYISKPYVRRCGNGELAISLSRRISRPDGSFGGVVSGALAIDYFRELLEGLHVGNNGTAAVIETNGTLIARLPFDPKVIGRSLTGADVFEKVMSSSEGTFVGNASIDGMRKIYVFKRLDNLPVVVDVAPAEADVYAEWRDRALYVGVLMFGFNLLVIGGSILLARELKQRALADTSLRYTARIDALTGLDNRGSFDSNIQREWRRAVQTASPLSLLFVDVDRFKMWNDRFGHRRGDDILKAVGRCIADCVRRPADHVARYGGEEFVVTLPDTSALAALIVAEDIRRLVADLALGTEKHEQDLTVSVGVATWAGRNDITADVLIEQADAALYRAKAAGRNCVREAGSEDGSIHGGTSASGECQPSQSIPGTCISKGTASHQYQ